MVTMIDQLGRGGGNQPANFQQKNDQGATGTSTGPYNHGQDGIFYLPYSNNRLVSTLIMPRAGLIDVLPVLQRDPYEDIDTGNVFGSRLYDFDTVMTGITEGDLEDFSNQPSSDCVEGPTGGLVKLCTQVNTMGRYRMSTKPVSLFRAGQAYTRLDQLSHTLLNSAEALQQFFGMPSNLPAETTIIMNEMAQRLFTMLVSFRRLFSRQIWNGSPANNNGQARQILGLQTQLNNGKVDAFSGASCPAADTSVYAFGYDMVDGSGRDIVEYLEKAEYLMRIDTERMGIGPVDGVLVMREALWYEITSVMPVKQYQEVLAALASQPNSTGARMVIDATGAQSDRDRFRSSMMLPLNGRLYRVVLDDGIPEQNSTNNANLGAGQFASDIFFVPLTFMGGMPCTFFEYYNHENMQAQGILESVAPNVFTFTSDGGSFRWHISYTNGCLTLTADFSPWLKVKAPYAGFRVTNVGYEPSLNARARSPYPDDPYFVNGGNVGTSGQPQRVTIYPDWLNGSTENI